ncbi:hypothetical protein ACIPY1_18860 [Paenarthrobacter nicotinovorans]|uniref:hypothetical protein n=1 Tax=Paenarthrobacter nicotinovorans TaxID=29320 RepID=UPI00380B99DC
MTGSSKLSEKQLNRPTQYGYRRCAVDHWGELIPADTVLLISKADSNQKLKGTVDAVSEDGSFLWLHLDEPRERKLFHRSDGYTTYVDPRPADDLT